MTQYYGGRILPPLKDLEGEPRCDNSMCYHIDCPDCIHYPTITSVSILNGYLEEKYKDTRVQDDLDKQYEE